MNIHENARTTPASRALLVSRIRQQGWSVPEAARSAGISRRTAYKWLGRFESEGKAGLRDRSCQARHRPHALPAPWQDLVLFFRRLGQSAREISDQLQVPRSTVSAVLARHGLGARAALNPPQPPCRYERRHAGELLHLDIKKLGRFWRPGHRVTGSRLGRCDGAGWEHVHVAIDDFSRIAYAEILPDEKGATCAAFLHRACRWFASQGITIKGLLTDNGTGYRSHRFRNACQSATLHHRRTRPYTPRTNGKAERFIQTMLREWAYGRRYRSSHERRKLLASWLLYYNQVRPHGSLGHLPPISRRPKLCEQGS